ncbi:hypothetical protein [Kitasatospora purpeofusca]|uniref:hypothetical protein n=1 Tax=Kitasatospora purpeofusca TaxID=67352 RepID=UPI002A5A4BB5|nr:hypothetical protein [Kitasatospora purpeofusca]MDY0815165.1 hypothetical protein [Kitasatospora purpeofusca]
MADDGVRVVLIGGTSNTGKSTLARLVADRLGFAYRSTDTLARHPGRPWPVPGWEVPPHVAEHYRTLTVEELVASVREHYARLRPRIGQLVAEGGGAGLVLEGSALWPPEVARLTGARGSGGRVSAHWLRADEAVLRTRIRTAGRYPEATPDGRYLMDKFLARSVRYQDLLLAEPAALGSEPLDAGDGRSLEELADVVVAAVTGAG